MKNYKYKKVNKIIIKPFTMQNLGTIDNAYTILSVKIKGLDFMICSVRHNQTQALHLIEVYKNEIPANLMNIMNNLIAINHPNITHIIGHGNGPIALNNEPQVNNPYIVYENVVHSNLYSYINIQHFTERQAKWIFKKILEGVQALHNANICHRHLMLENILLDENYNPKLYMFFLSRINMNNLQDISGNRIYKAPEIINEQPYDGKIADIFSLGQILFNIVTGCNGFFSAKPNDSFYSHIVEQNIEKYWEEIYNQIHLILSDNFKNLFIGMVDPKPARRPTIVQILNDPWMQEINNLTEAERNALENEVRNEFGIREQQIQPNHLNVDFDDDDN